MHGRHQDRHTDSAASTSPAAPTPAGAPPIVLFDLDGTLINTKRLYLECYRRAVVPHIGRELTVDEILALQPRSELRFLRDVVGPDRLAHCMEDFYRAYAALHDSHFRGIYAGIPEMLAALRTTSIPLGIVTGKSRRSWDLTAARAALGPFDVLVFDDDVAEPKPDPEGLRLALDRIGADAARTLYLGDSVVDMEAAVAAGARPCAALWAKKPVDRESFRARIGHLDVSCYETPAAFVRAIGRAGKSA